MYATAIRSLRVRELQTPACMTAVRAGLGSIIPLQLQTMLSPLEMELRTCGLPYINLEFLEVRRTANLKIKCEEERKAYTSVYILVLSANGEKKINVCATVVELVVGIQSLQLLRLGKLCYYLSVAYCPFQEPDTCQKNIYS